MRKIFAFIISVVLVMQLSSCKITIEKKMELGGDVNDIVAINVYEVEREEYIGSEMGDSVLEIRDECEPVCTLMDDEIKPFIDDLLTLKYARNEFFPLHIDYAHLFAPGYVVFIEYSCTGFDVYAEKGIYTHRHSDDNIQYSYSPDDCRGEISFTDFIEKYLQ